MYSGQIIDDDYDHDDDDDDSPSTLDDHEYLVNVDQHIQYCCNTIVSNVNYIKHLFHFICNHILKL